MKILCLDFDGVCHSYGSGWKGAAVIPDSPVPGLFQFLESAKPVFEVVIFSSRSNEPSGREAMIDWFELWKPGSSECLGFPTEKPAAAVTLDDRAMTFTGVWPEVNELLSFKPWYLEKPDGILLTKKHALAVLDKNFTEAGINITVTRFNKILTDLGFEPSP